MLQIIPYIAVATGLLGLFSAVWRVQKVITNIENSVRKLEYDHDKKISDLSHHVDMAIMTASGYKDQIGHNAMKHKTEEDKLHGRIDKLSLSLSDLENFIQKTTPFEKRHER